MARQRDHEDIVASATMGGLIKAAYCPDPQAATEPARTAFRAKLERQVDPDATMPAEELARRTEQLLKAHMLKMRLARKTSIRKRAEAQAQIDAAEAELRELGDPGPGAP